MPDKAQAIPFWKSVAQAFRGNDAVIFDLFNEPFPQAAVGTEAGGCAAGGGRQRVHRDRLSGGGHAGAGQCGAVGPRVERDHAGRNSVGQRPHPVAALRAGRSRSQPGGVLALLQLQRMRRGELLEQSGRSGDGTGPGRRRRDGGSDCADAYIGPLMRWLDARSTSYLAWAWNTDFACEACPARLPATPGPPPLTAQVTDRTCGHCDETHRGATQTDRGYRSLKLRGRR